MKTLPTAFSFLLISTIAFFYGSCPGPSPPKTGIQQYSVQKTMSPSCGVSVACIDFDGVGSYATSAGTCPGNAVTFTSDNSEIITLDIATSTLLPGQTFNAQFTDTDSNGVNIQGPYTLTLGSATGGQHWEFKFAENASAPMLPLTPGKPIGGHYTVEALGAFNMTSPTILIQAQKTVTSSPPPNPPPAPPTYTCSEN
jgi:hypothetical protein